jgi:hypothetical protein
MIQQKTELGSNPDVLGRNSWCLFCLGILILRFALFALDPLPKFYGGDSKSYLWTAISGWIPEDRSYFYGYVIRWVALSTGSLTSLLVIQILAGVAIAVVCAWLCLRVFELPRWLSFVFGLLCCLDPIQLYWERAVMTETLSLFFYVLLLQRSFLYIKKQRIVDLVLVQFISVLLIGFRMSYLLLTWALAVVLPLLAFARLQNYSARKRLIPAVSNQRFVKKILRVCLHCFLGMGTMLLLHTAYKRANGFLSHRGPSYLYATGVDLLSFWAPAVRPSDAPDSRVAELIRRGDEFQIKDMNSRAAQLHMKGFLIDRLHQIEPDPKRSDDLAHQVALNALRRNPLGIATLAWKTYAAFWGTGVREWAKLDLPTKAQFSDTEATQLGLARRFHQVVTPMGLTEAITFNGWYYLAAWPYYYVILLSPLILGTFIALQRSARRYSALLFFNMAILFASTLFFSGQPQIRYLQPLSVLTILTFAMGVRVFLDRCQYLEGYLTTHFADLYYWLRSRLRRSGPLP